MNTAFFRYCPSADTVNLLTNPYWLGVGEGLVTLSAYLRRLSSLDLAAIAVYTVTGAMLLVFLPLTGYPPHVGFVGIISVITAYSLFTRRSWGRWLVFFLLVTISGFTFYTLYVIWFSNLLVALSMITYAALTWATSLGLLLRRD
jgi:hypothetical protein